MIIKYSLILLLAGGLCDAGASQFCPSKDSCTETHSNWSGAPCGTPCGSCVTIINNRRPECRQCSAHYFLNRHFKCYRCRGSRTNNEANVKRSCTDPIHTYNDTANKTAIETFVTAISNQNVSTAKGRHLTTTESPSQDTSSKESTRPIPTPTPHPNSTNDTMSEADLGVQYKTTTPSPPDSGGITKSHLVGGIIGGSIGLVIIILVVVYCKEESEMKRQNRASPEPASATVPFLHSNEQDSSNSV